MLSWALAFGYLLLLFATGAALLPALRPRDSRPLTAELWIPAAFVLGVFAHAFLCLLAILVLGRIPWPGIFGVHAAIIVGGFLLQARRPEFAALGTFSFLEEPPPAGGERRLFLILGALCLLFVSTQYYNAFLFPFTGYDGQAIWSFKGAILAQEGTVLSPSFRDPDRIHYHRDYPLLIPSMMAGLYWLLGETDEPRVRMLLATFFPMTLLFTFGALRRMGIPAPGAALGVLPLFGLPVRNDYGERDGGVLNSGSVDTQFALFAFVSFVSFFFYLREGRGWQWRLAAVGCAACLCTKAEGIIVLAILGGCGIVGRFRTAQAACWPREAATHFLLLATVIGLALPWLLVSTMLPNYYDEQYLGAFGVKDVIAALPRLEPILRAMASDLGRDVWSILFPTTFLLWALALFLPKVRGMLFLDLTILAWLAICVFIYLVSPLNLAFHINTSSARLFSQIYPLAAFRVVLGLCQLFGFALDSEVPPRLP